MSVKTARAWYIIGFVFGILCIVVGIFLICLQFFEKGTIFKTAPSDLSDIFAGYAVLGVVSIGVGVLLIYNFYQIVVPLKENNLISDRACPHCGAIVEEDAIACEKCKQPITDN